MKSSKRARTKLSLLAVFATIFMLFNQVSFAKDISSEQAWASISNGATLIDVRTAEEFAAGHIEGAINIPFDNIVNGISKLTLSPDSEIVLYCRSGRRSGIADQSLSEAGFTNSMNAGGFNALKDSKP
ncbi:rhodanese-like domain-containing protein [Shewanella aestuarii]|uniref:Rhodanese-like domain-containing protein n=1 Tax=Shewanella aestuarii TaxID=1028752 RepID=A0A6G9QKH2_9GAMM|nr:rhodanese-like domain-containing protein [Shewanella aestuarii]QIR15026.1 rhodanese-like domain-containing protein [Shewanella aestuarii]